MAEDTTRIEISFPSPVDVNNDDIRIIDAITTEICRRYERTHPGRVMWPSGVGAKITYIPMTRADELAGRHMEFDRNTFSIACAEREDYDWPCAKCGIEQGEHKSCIIGAKAGDCDFEPAKKDLAPEPVTGLVPMRVYLSAVKGRQDMRQALREAREKIKALEQSKESA